MEKQILKTLRKIIDPELNLNIVDLGLIYKIEINQDRATILMTLTSPLCPYGKILVLAVKEKVKAVKNIKFVKVKLTFTPPWSLDKASKAVRMQLG